MSQATLSAALVRARNRRNARQSANRRDYNAHKITYEQWNAADAVDEDRYHAECMAEQTYDDGKITAEQLNAIIRGTNTSAATTSNIAAGEGEVVTVSP